MSTIKVNGKTVNLSRDAEAKEVYDSAVAEFEEAQGSRPTNRTAAKTWDNDLNTYVVQALKELLDQRAAAADEQVSEVSTTSESDSDYEATEAVPAYPSTATHRVYTEGRGLALRANYAVMRASDYAKRDKGRKGDLIEMLDDDTEVIVLDEGVGYHCQWAQVTVPDLDHAEPAYVMYKFLEPLDDTAASLEMIPSKKSKPDLDAWYINWDTRKVNKVYFDRRTAKWCIPVETQYTTTGGSQLRTRMEEALYTGVETILEYLDKKHSTEYIEELMASFSFARAEDWYLDPRPRSHLRVFVTVPEKYIGGLEDLPARGKVTMKYSPEKEYDKSGSSLAAGDVKYYNSFFTNKMRDHLNAAADKLYQYNKDIRKSGYGIEPCIDLAAEADQLRGVLSKLKMHMVENDQRFREEKDDLIEVGFDANFKLVWVSYTTNSFPVMHKVSPTKGFSQLTSSEPFDNPITMGLLYFAQEISNENYNQLPWMEFLAAYMKRMVPELTVYPSDSSRCPSDSDIDLADAVSAEMKTKDGKKSASVKLNEENNFLNNLDLKAAIVAEYKDRKDYTGDPVLQDLQHTLSQIEDLDDAFKFILSRIPIGDLLLRLLACQQITLPSVEIDLSAIGDMMDDLSDLAGGVQDLFDKVDALWEPELPKNFKIPKLSLPDKMPIADIMAGFKDMLVEMVKEMITMMFVEMVKGLLEGLVADCKDLDSNTTDDYGGENIGDMLDDSGTSPDDVADLFDAMGLTPEPAEDEAAADEDAGPAEDTPVKQISGFLDDVSALLTPGELCTLMNGNPPDYVVDLVKSLIVNYRQEFSKLESRSKIVAAFRALGGLADSSLCDKLAEGSTGAPKLYLPTDRPLCDVDGSLQRLREDLLRDKGDDITDDQIEEMLDRVKDRKKKQADQITNLLEELGENDGEFVAPPVFCQKNPDGTITPGMMDELPESVTFMMKKAIDTMFEPTYMAFNLDAQEWAKPMIENTSVTQQVPTLVSEKLKNEDGDMEQHWVPHPEVKRQMAQGIPEVAFLKKKANPFELEHDDYINEYTDISTQKKRVAPHLKDSLEGLESNDSFAMNYNESGSYYYELVLPPDPNAVSAMQGLQDLEDLDFGDLDIDTSVFSQFQGALPTWSVEYHLPAAKGMIEEEEEEATEEELALDLLDAARVITEGEDEEEEEIVTELGEARVAEVVDPSTYLDDEYIISVKMNNEPIIFVQNSVPMETARKNLIEAAIDSDFSSVEYSPQQEVFGEYVKSMWQSKIGSSETLTTKYDEMAPYFKETVFSQISKDLFSHVSREVAASPFFEVIESTVGSGDNKIWSWTPKVEMVVLNPDPTDAQRACNVDPHLLNLDCLKKKVMDDALAGMCDDDPPATDGKGSDKMNSIERAAMDACVRTTIRANLIDYFLRGVFAFSTFDIESVMDGAAMDMYGKLMEQDIRAYSENYNMRFLEQADLTYYNMVAEGYFEEEEAQREAAIAAGTLNEFSQPSGWSMPYLIKEQIADVAKDLQDLLGTSGRVTSVKDKWLSTYVPVFDSPSSSYDVRFAELNDDVVTADNYSKGDDYWSDYETGDVVTDTETLITSKDGVSFDLENGNFILERYIKVVDKDGLKQEWLDTARRLGAQAGSTTAFANTTGVVNPTDFSQFIVQILETDLDAAASGEESVRPDASLNELFSELKYGYRLTYIPPMSSAQTVEVPYVSGSESGSYPRPSSDYSSVLSSQTFPTLTTGLGDSTYNFGELAQGFGEEHLQAAKEEAAFVVYETFPADKVTFNFDGAVDTHTLEDTEMVKLITPIPLVSVEEDIDLTMLLGDVDSGAYFDTNHPTTELHAAIQEDDWFNVLFEYIFPLNRFMSIMTLYSITAVSNYDGVPLSFEGTRDELHRLFWILLNGGDYTYEDENLMCIGGSGGLGNASGKLASTLAKCFGLNFGFGLCLKGLGLGFVFKMMLMTPVLVFKLVVEFMDPNIAIAVKLFSLGCLLGIAIPIPIISFGMLPMNIFLGMPGPPITPLGLIYLALGLGNLDLSVSAGGDSMDLGIELPNKAADKGMDTDGGCLPECEDG